MCTFLSELPKNSKTTETKQQMLYLPIMPSGEKEYYRFRLLWFKSPSKNDRDYPFIERYVHMHFTKDENDKWSIESQVVCPVTPYVKKKWEGDAYSTCPVCNFANHNFAAYKESGWKDKESGRKQKEFGRKFEACIPVYVVCDPNYDVNQGKFKVIKFTDKKEYERFKDLVTKYSHDRLVFNGKNAVDFYIRMETVEEKLREGQPNEYVWKHNVISQMGFTNKPYDIPAITKEAVDAFEFDDQFYVSSTKEELKEYYDRYCRKMNNDDIPEDEDIKIFKSSKDSSKSVKKTNSVDGSDKFSNKEEIADASSVKVPENDIDDFDDDFDLDESKKEKSNAKESTKSDEIDDVLNFEEATKKNDAEEKKNSDVAEVNSNTSSKDVDLDDIDALLDDI